MEPDGISTNCISEPCFEPCLDSTAHFVDCQLSTEGISAVSCSICSGRIQQRLLHTHQWYPLVVNMPILFMDHHHHSLSRYRWLCYINPNYYGFSASSVILLTDFESDCEHDGGSALECYTFSGKYILDAFNFTNINPYKNIAVSRFSREYRKSTDSIYTWTLRTT